ncbi:MAG: type II toxin-antitoxin system VapC family toxin [Candidatus Riflebacteria bacterium]|nr:type II toxin-antitoxin system VapC family toxin [Candidatus Riflebacteria bacterium]
MQKPLFVDTAFIIALLNAKDSYHSIACKLSAKYETQPLIVTDAVLLEIGNALAKGFKQEAIDVIEQFIASEDVEIVNLSQELFKKAFQLFKKHSDKDWSLVDCCSFVVMKENHLTQALTCDKHFAQAGFEPLMKTTI